MKYDEYEHMEKIIIDLLEQTERNVQSVMSGDKSRVTLINALDRINDVKQVLRVHRVRAE